MKSAHHTQDIYKQILQAQSKCLNIKRDERRNPYHQFWLELITNKSSNPVVLDNYDTDSHLKHTEHLAGSCTIITGKRAIKHRLPETRSGWTQKVTGSMWENIHVYTSHLDLLKSDLQIKYKRICPLNSLSLFSNCIMSLKNSLASKLFLFFFIFFSNLSENRHKVYLNQVG